MNIKNAQQRYFVFTLLGICLLYLGFEFFYNSYAMLSVDEFWFAHLIYHYKDGLPYRDFAPYKTILGYYLLLLPMLTTHSIIQTLIVTKNFIAILNTLFLFISSCWLARFFSRPSILISLALLVSSEIVLSYTTQIRVDFLGYWFCFFSLLLLLEKRFILAGMLIGLGFATTQKAIWYIFASNCALAVYWLITERTLKSITNIIKFNCAFAGIFAGYFIFWSWISDWHTVFSSVFDEASAMYNLDWYDSARMLFWKSIIFYNPLLFLLWPATLFSVFITYNHDNNYHQRVFIVTYASIILLCLVPFKQVFPYYMQVTVPVVFILYSSFVSWLSDILLIKNSPRLLINKSSLWILLALYLSAIIYLVLTLPLPFPYLLICLIPSMIIFFISNAAPSQKTANSILRMIIITAMFTGFIYPSILFLSKITYINGSYQKAHIQVINSLLSDGSDYVAGIELIYNKTQRISGLRHLMGPAIDYLYAPTPKLKSVMLASLYEDPNVTVASIITALTHSSVKFYVNNYRIMALPPKLKDFLHSQYTHWWGSIYVYSPQISKGIQIITLKFSGKYLIESDSAIYLNDKQYLNQVVVYLKKGNYQSNASHDYRLKLIPELPINPNIKFIKDNWGKIIF